MKNLEAKIEELEERKEKKKKFSFKRLFAYIGVYVILSFCFGFVIVLGTDTTSSSSLPTLDIEDEEPPTAFASLINNLMSMKDFSSDLALSLTTEDSSNLTIGGNLDVILYEGYTGAEVNANINVNYGGEEYNLALLYKNDSVFLTLNEFNYTFKASSFISGLGVILQTAGVDVSGLDGLLENFDMSILNSIESMLSEESFENYKLLTLKISDALQVKIKTDLNYNIEQIYLNEFNYNQNLIDLSLNLKEVNSGHEIEVPEDKTYVDISESTSLIEALLNTVKEDNISANISVTGKENFAANLLISKENDLKVQLSTSLFNKEAGIYYENNKIFLSYSNVKLKADLEDFDAYLDAINKILNTDLSSLNNLFDSNKLSEILRAILNIKEISKTDDVIVLNINNYVITFKLNENKLSEVYFEVGDYAVNILLGFENELVPVNESEYLNANNLIDFVDPILNTISKTNFSGSIVAKYLDEELTINYALNVQDGLKAEISTSYLGINLQVLILKNNIYVNLNNIKIKASFNELESLIESLKEVLKLELPNLSAEEILASEKLIQEFAFIVNGLYLKTFDASITLSHNGEFISALEVSYKDINVKVNLNKVDNQNLEIAPSNDYVNYSDVKELITNTIEFINFKNYNFNIAFSYQGVSVLGYLGIKENLINADLIIKYNALEISLKIIDNVIFAEFNGLKITCNLKEIENLIEFIQSEFNINFNELLGDFDNIKEEFNKEKINEILNKILINYDKNSLKIDFENLKLNINLNNNKLNSINLIYEEISANLSVINEKVVSKKEGYYIDLIEILPLLSATKHTLENGYISGDLTLKFNAFNEENTVNASYGISFKDEILAYIKTNFKGVNVTIYYVDNTFYLDLAGLKLYVKTSEIKDLISFINNTFNTDLSFDFQELDLENLNLDIISEIISNNGLTKILFKDGYNLELTYSSYVQKVKFSLDGLNIDINCTDFNAIVFDEIDKNSYMPFATFTNLITNVLNTANDKNFNISADTVVYTNGQKENIDIDLIFSLESEIKLYGKVSAGSEIVEVYYENGYVYAKYKELKLKVSISSLKEILSLALQILGIDPASIPLLDSIGEDINLDNIQGLLPDIDFGNPLNLLELVNSLSFDGSTLKLNLNGDKITSIKREMNVIIYTSTSGVEAIELNNIFTAENTYFNAYINRNEYAGVPSLENLDGFIDISESSKLLKAILNTTSLTDYQIKGTIIIEASVIGLPIEMSVPVVANIKLLDGKMVIYAELSIPVIGSNVPGFTKINVNNDVPYKSGDTSVESRNLKIYYADNFFYFHRTDKVKQTVFASRTYEKKLKVSSEELFSDPMYYLLQYGFGFSNDIMSEIDKAIEKSLNRETPLDYSKILLDYKNNNTYQTIVINLAEIANNDMLESATLDFYTQLLNNKEYFSKLCFDVYMPIASAFELNLKTEDLSLVNIGEEINVDSALKFIEEYPYLENQMYEASNGSWSLASEKQYTITFVSDYQGNPESITARVNAEVLLPSLEDFVQDDGVTKKSYYFKGWYTSTDFAEEFTSNVMPRGDVTLYAKWDIITEYYRTITLLGGLDGEEKITKLEGEFLELPVYSVKQETEGDVTTTYKFQGWQDEEGKLFTSSTIPTEDKTLTAIWEVISVEVTKQFELYDEDELIYSIRVKSGEEIVLPQHEKINAETKYYLDNAFTYEYQISTMPEENLTLFVRNKYELTVTSNYGEVISSKISLYQGESYTLPNQASYYYDDKETIRIDYTFNGYKSSVQIDYFMPNENIEIYADWSVLEREYFTITFDTRWYIPIGWVSEGILVSAPTEVKPVKVLEGESLDLTQFVSTTQRKYTRISKTYTWKTESWGLEPFGNLSTKEGVTVLENVQSDMTLYACWYKQ